MPRSSDRALRHPLVVGGGFIGTHVARALAERGVPVRVLNRSPLQGDRLERLGQPELLVGDASVRPTLRRALDGIDHVFFCAGGLMPAESNLDPATDAALALPPLLNALEELRDRLDVGFTYLSSGGTVYGNPRQTPVPEAHPTDPVTSYGIMKLASEKYVAMYARLYGVRARILRCSNVYGEFQPAARGQGFIAAALQALLEERPITVFGDGLNVRDYLYARDLAHVMLQLAPRDEGPLLLNVGSGEGIALLDLIALIERVTGRTAEIHTRPDRGFDVRRIVLDVSALRAVVPFEPTPLADGIAAAWDALYRDVPA